jgi:hypothetical protein
MLACRQSIDIPLPLQAFRIKYLFILRCIRRMSGTIENQLFRGTMNRLSGTRSLSILPTLCVVCSLLLCGIAASQDLPQIQPRTGAQGKRIVDMSIDELGKCYASELSDLRFDSSQDGLASLLKNAGMRVEEFFRVLPNTSSKEQVLLKIINADGAVQSASKKEFSYLIFSQGSQSELAWKEDRLDMKGSPAGLENNEGFILTSGFAFLCDCVRFENQPGSRFRYLGRAGFGNGAYVIAFAQKPEPVNYRASYIDPLTHIQTRYLIQGLVWLQPDDYQIMRMQTSAIGSAGPVQYQTTDVHYWKVQFEGVPNSFWLPYEVTVDLKVRGNLYRNQHRYSDYKLFGVQTDYHIIPPEKSTSGSRGPEH